MTRDEIKSHPDYLSYEKALGAMWRKHMQHGISFIRWVHIETVLYPAYGLAPHWGITTVILCGWGFTITDKGVSYETK